MPHQPGWERRQASGVFADAGLERDYDSGLSLGWNGTFAAADPLSRGRYDGDAIERLVASAAYRLGKIEVGLPMAPAMAWRCGPKVDPGVSLEDARTSFYPRSRNARARERDVRLAHPGRALQQLCQDRLYQPVAVRGAAGFVLHAVGRKAVAVPECGAACAGRQVEFWEAALRYETELGTVSLTAMARWRRAAPNTSCRDRKAPAIWAPAARRLSAGRGDQPVLGGAIARAMPMASTSTRLAGGHHAAGHVSAAVTTEQWMAGLEYGNGVADKSGEPLPRLGLNGLEASSAIKVSDSIAVSSGWQHQSYSRSSGHVLQWRAAIEDGCVYSCILKA
jgi:hypothetical protein